MLPQTRGSPPGPIHLGTWVPAAELEGKTEGTDSGGALCTAQLLRRAYLAQRPPRARPARVWVLPTSPLAWSDCGPRAGAGFL